MTDILLSLLQGLAVAVLLLAGAALGSHSAGGRKLRAQAPAWVAPGLDAAQALLARRGAALGIVAAAFVALVASAFGSTETELGRPLPEAAVVGGAAPIAPGSAAADEGDLAVSFTFAPAVVTPGESVSLHLSPPWPATVRLGGHVLTSEIRNGGRTLIVTVPAQVAGSRAFFELEAGGRRARAGVPLEIVGEPGVALVAYAEVDEAGLPVAPATAAAVAAAPALAPAPEIVLASATEVAPAPIARTDTATAVTPARPAKDRAAAAATLAFVAGALPPAHTISTAATPSAPSGDDLATPDSELVLAASVPAGELAAEASARVAAAKPPAKVAKAEARAKRRVAHKRSKAREVARRKGRNPCKRAYLPLDLARCIAGARG